MPEEKDERKIGQAFYAVVNQDDGLLDLLAPIIAAECGLFFIMPARRWAEGPNHLPLPESDQALTGDPNPSFFYANAVLVTNAALADFVKEHKRLPAPYALLEYETDGFEHGWGNERAIRIKAFTP